MSYIWIKKKMLLNISYNEPKVKEKIETLVGKPFYLKRDWQ